MTNRAKVRCGVNVEIAVVAARMVDLKVVHVTEMMLVARFFLRVILLAVGLVVEPEMVFVHLMLTTAAAVVVAVDVRAAREVEDHVLTYVAVAHFVDHEFAMTVVLEPKDALHHRLQPQEAIQHVVYAIVADVREAYVVDAYPKEPWM